MEEVHPGESEGMQRCLRKPETAAQGYSEVGGTPLRCVSMTLHACHPD